MSIDWDGLAANADAGIPGLIGKIQGLYDDGKLKMVVAGWAYEDADGSIVHGFTFEPANDVWAMGLIELIKVSFTDPSGFRDAEDQR